MQFCLLSRRLQDGGYTALPAVGILLLSVFTLMGTIDPKLLGSNSQAQEEWLERLELAWSAMQVGYAILYCLCVISASESGSNAHGPEFGTTTGSAKKKQSASQKRAARIAESRRA
jgi:uncharacterized membrane protein YhaH (DUF805 family)